MATLFRNAVINAMPQAVKSRAGGRGRIKF